MTPLDKILSEIEARLHAYTSADYSEMGDDISRLLKACRILASALDVARFDLQTAIDSKTGINVVAPRLIDEAIKEATKALEGK